MTQIIDLIQRRQSVRKYNPDKKIERALIEKCIEAARLAPSACNAQPWKFIAVIDPQLCKQVTRETYGPLMKFNKFSLDAPVIMVITYEKPNFKSRFGTTVKKVEYPLIDIGIAAQHFCLQAEELGIGTCMIGWFNEKPIQKLLSIPSDRKVALCITMGYPPDGYKFREKQRKSTQEMSSYNSYGQNK